MKDALTCPNPLPPVSRPSWSERLIPWLLLVLLGLNVLAVGLTLGWPSLQTPFLPNFRILIGILFLAWSISGLSVYVAFFWAMGPLLQVARQRRLPLQLLVVDLVCLAIQLLIAAGIVAVRPVSEPTDRWGPMVPVGVTLLAFWSNGVLLLARAGISRWPQRTGILPVVVPVAGIGFAVSLLPCWTLLHAMFMDLPTVTRLLYVLGSLAGIWGFVGAAYAVGRVNRRIVRVATTGEENVSQPTSRYAWLAIQVLPVKSEDQPTSEKPARSGDLASWWRRLHPGPAVTIVVLAGALVGSFWPEGRAVLFFLLEIAVLLSPVAAIALAIASLLPLDRAAKQVEAKIQFTLVDFLFLFFLIQMPMALIFGWVPDDRTRFRWLLLVYAWGAFGTMWLASAQRLSRAGIERSSRRALFLGLVLPSAIFGVLGSPVFCVIGLQALIGDNWRQAGVALAAQAGLLQALVVSRRVTRWLVVSRELAPN